MERDLFDKLARNVAELTSRRSLVRAIAGGSAVTALTGLPAMDSAESKKKRKNKKKCKVRKCPKPANPCQEAICKKDKCRTRDLPDGSTCGNGLECVAGECVCPAGQKFCDGACIPEGDPCFVAVTATSLQGWLLEGEDAFSQSPLLTQIVDGPGDPPAPGTGSVKLDPTAFDGFNEDQTQAVLRTLQYAGTPIGDIDRLEYSVFVPSTGGDAPTMQLAVTGDFNTPQFASLVFIPGANGNTAPDLDDWTDYTPATSGFWASTRDILGPGGECVLCRSIGGSAHEGACTDATTCSANTLKTWAQIQAAIPDAQLNGETANEGGFSFRIGRGETGAGYATNVVFNNDGYFFEAD